MENAPRGLRRHIAIFGKTNAGKSTLFNLLTNGENAIVSETSGTTTDPVLKNMELIPFGPVTLIDTAGLDDKTELGGKRMKKTREFIRRADLGIMLADASEYESGGSHTDESFFTGEIIHVFSKCDLCSEEVLENIKKQYPEAFFISKNNQECIDYLKRGIVKKLNDVEKDTEDTLIGGLVPYGGTVVMIVPIDSAAPKGRLILPQVQLIRDCLDHGIKIYVTKETELEGALSDLNSVNLAVTDSQAFAFVNKAVPMHIPLTSFSMLLAHQKGNFKQLLDGINSIKNLKDNDKILMLEACTHSHTHEDIGRVKIPKLLNGHTGKILHYDFYSGYNMPDCLDGYALSILCGGCMINKKEIQYRLDILKKNNIPATNYGVILAYLNGTLDRCKTVFE